VESEHLEAAHEIDSRYHEAKLTAAAFNDPERIWSEHEQVRAAILTGAQPKPEMSQADWMARVAAIDRKMRNAGLVPPRSGEMH
jgi:hypothetical protein